MRYSGVVQARFRQLSLAVLFAACGCGSGTSGNEADPAAEKSASEDVDPLPAWSVPARAANGPLEDRLVDAELRRDPDDPAIQEALDSNPRELRRGALALARIGGPIALRRLAALLEDEAAASAWGTLALLDPPRDVPGAPPEPRGAWAELEDALWLRYALAGDDQAARARALLLGIARIGGERSVERLAADLARPPVGAGHQRYADAMSALAILCARGHPLTESARDVVAQGLGVPEPSGRRAAIYALGRCARPSAEVLALANEREVIVERLVPRLEQGGDEELRLAWKAFAALGELPEEIPAPVLSDQPPDWKTEVEAARALAATAAGRRIALERVSHLDLSRFSGPRLHVLIELLRGLRGSAANDDDLAARLPGLRESIQSATQSAEPHQRHALAVAGCEIELLASIKAGSLDALLSCDDDVDTLPTTYAESLAVEALLHMGSAMTREQRVERLLRRAEDERPPVAAPALAALAEVDDPRANTVLRKALDRPDVSITSAAASAIAARSVDASKRDPEAVPVLVRTVRRLSNHDAVEARIAAIEALGSLGRDAKAGVDPSAAETPAAAPPDPWLADVVLPLHADPSVAVRRAARDALLDHASLLQRFDAQVATAGGEFGPELAAARKRLRERAVHGLRFSTTAGAFVLDFRGALAPINQANLTELASEGYFDGLRWHRVVPDFVVQGGDPRGDGYGGPGHLVPCEWSTLRYERGTVGIALAGKDTGGSQLFVTHSRQPHLDARYTIVGRVTEGMEVVDRLMPADRILEVTLVTGGR